MLGQSARMTQRVSLRCERVRALGGQCLKVEVRTRLRAGFDVAGLTGFSFGTKGVEHLEVE